MLRSFYIEPNRILKNVDFRPSDEVSANWLEATFPAQRIIAECATDFLKQKFTFENDRAAKPSNGPAILAKVIQDRLERAFPDERFCVTVQEN